MKDIDFTETEGDETYRKKLEALAAEKGAEYLHALLSEADPKAAEEIHANNIKRTIRALEYHHFTGQRISDHNEEEKQKYSPYNFAYFVLNRDRAEWTPGRSAETEENGLYKEYGLHAGTWL